MASSSRRVLLAALAGNGALALVKFAAAAVSGSSGMLAEAVHSVLDTGNQVLMLYGLRRSRQPPDEDFPFGYGKEIYFWSFVVAIQLFTVGAGLAVVRGVYGVLHPEPLRHVSITLLVLGIAALFDGATWTFSLLAFSRTKGQRNYVEAIREGKDPSRFLVLFEDSASLLGIGIVAAGIVAQQLSGRLWLDGTASILVGLVLAVTALWLAYETKGLLIGESASDEVVADIWRIASQLDGIRRVCAVRSMHMGPQYIVVGVSAVLAPGASDDGGRTLSLLEQRVRSDHPNVKQVFIKAIPG